MTSQASAARAARIVALIAMIGVPPLIDTASAQDVRIAATVLSADDSRRMLGADIPATGMQPVWIEVHNGSQRALWLLRSALSRPRR